MSRPVSASSTEVRRVPPRHSGVRQLMRRAVSMELAGWASIARFLSRRPVVPPGADAFSYDAPFRGTLIVFLVVSAVEVVAVDLVTHRWPDVRLPLLVLGIWGVLFMLGMLLGFVTRPHAVGPDGIRFRCGAEVDVDLPWELVRSATPRRLRLTDAPALCLTGPPNDQTLHQVVESRTDIEVELQHAITIELPAGPVAIRRLHLAVDDPKAFARAVGRHAP